MWRRQPSKPQLQRTRLPRVLATWLHLVHSEPGGELLPSERDETDLDRQQREGERVLGSGRQREAEVLLDWRQRERQEHQVAKKNIQKGTNKLLNKLIKKHQVAQRQEVQQRQVVQHWRVSLETLLEFVNATLTFFSVLEGHSQTTERATKTALRSLTTSTTMASGDLFTHVDLIHLLLLLVPLIYSQLLLAGSTTFRATTESLQSARRS